MFSVSPSRVCGRSLQVNITISTAAPRQIYALCVGAAIFDCVLSVIGTAAGRVTPVGRGSVMPRPSAGLSKR